MPVGRKGNISRLQIVFSCEESFKGIPDGGCDFAALAELDVGFKALHLAGRR